MASTAYEEYLVMGAFEGRERREMLPQWIEAANRIGLTEKDMEFAVKEWIPEMWDLQYLGVRKMIGAITREAIDHSKLMDYRKQGVKLVYGIIPAILTPYQAIKKAGGDKVFVGFPDLTQMNMLQPLFHRGAPLFELAEQSGLTYGCRHCALNKLRIGLHLKGVVPSPGHPVVLRSRLRRGHEGRRVHQLHVRRQVVRGHHPLAARHLPGRDRRRDPGTRRLPSRGVQGRLRRGATRHRGQGERRAPRRGSR